MATESKSKKKWFPLESNPTLMNKYLSKIGVNLDQYECFDVFGFDEELLGMVPTPSIAVLLLFPITKENEDVKKKEETTSDKEKNSSNTAKDKLFFCKQTIGNACGTIGLLHAVGNNTDKLTLKPNSFIEDFLAKSKDLSPEKRATLLEEDDRVEDVHKEVATSEENASSAESSVDTHLHFVCFVEKDGQLYELDGRRSSPMYRGPTTSNTLLYDSVKVVKHYMNLNPNEMNFGVIALAKK